MRFSHTRNIFYHKAPFCFHGFRAAQQLAEGCGKNMGRENMSDDSHQRHININKQRGLIYFLPDFCFLSTG